MYLVVRSEESCMGNRNTYDCFCMKDQSEVSKILKTGNFHVYKLDSLQRLDRIDVTSTEVIANG